LSAPQRVIYFPGDRSADGISTRLAISLPARADGLNITADFLAYVQSASSRDVRLAIGNPTVDELQRLSREQQRSVSEVVLHRLLARFHSHQTVGVAQQLALLEGGASARASTTPAAGGAAHDRTFKETKLLPVHGWYPYVEGFSGAYIRNALLRASPTPRVVYDPFGGAGTTQLIASTLGIRSLYSEINPFMAFVAETKVASASWARKHIVEFANAVELYVRELNPKRFERRAAKVDLTPYHEAFPDRDFFQEKDIRELVAARDVAIELTQRHPHARSMLLLSVAANAVHSSNMTRRADLRRRRPDEYKTRVVDVKRSVSLHLMRMLEDIQRLPFRMAPTTLASEDARTIGREYANAADMAITSPPYLNGTNYFRNTKIELWLLGFLRHEAELGAFNRRAIAAGINNISKDRTVTHTLPSVERVARVLDEDAYDARIPTLVRQYFSDMWDVLDSVFRTLVPGGRFLLDIGDSKFSGVHVPTDRLLADVAAQVGFRLEQRQILAKRYSRDKSELVQVELQFLKPRVQTRPTKASGGLEERIDAFARELPFKREPFSRRNWGHPLHSLCSYQGKLKPGLAHWLVDTFVPEGGTVLDPLGGVGTIAFEAALTGRKALSNDMSPFASTVASGKLDPPTPAAAEEVVSEIERRMGSVELDSSDFLAAEFGLNATVQDYYHPDTLIEVLKARRVFLADSTHSTAEAFVWSCLLHSLHGNRPYALSRTSHPITPFNPSGPRVYKSVIETIRQRAKRLASEALPDGFVRGNSTRSDFRDLPSAATKFDAIITSPPFLGMRFDRPNWLRMWFCGWNADDFHKTSLGFLERQQLTSSVCYEDFFRTCSDLLAADGVLVVHMGSGGRRDLANDLRDIGKTQFRLRGEVSENVEGIEQHGIRDKGLTTTHHFLFFTPR
jgi:DNA modification methylase